MFEFTMTDFGINDYCEYADRLKRLSHKDIVEIVADNLIPNDILKHYNISKMEIYSESNEVYIYDYNFPQDTPVEIIELPLREDELAVLEYCRRCKIPCGDY